MPSIAYPNQHIDIEILQGSRDHVIVLDTVKITFNLDIEPTNKVRSVVIVNNVGRALAKKKVLMLGSKYIDTLTTPIFMTRARTFTCAKKNVKRSYFQAYSWPMA